MTTSPTYPSEAWLPLTPDGRQWELFASSAPSTPAAVIPTTPAQAPSAADQVKPVKQFGLKSQINVVSSAAEPSTDRPGVNEDVGEAQGQEGSTRPGEAGVTALAGSTAASKEDVSRAENEDDFGHHAGELLRRKRKVEEKRRQKVGTGSV
jgi:hypothetical protein